MVFPHLVYHDLLRHRVEVSCCRYLKKTTVCALLVLAGRAVGTEALAGLPPKQQLYVKCLVSLWVMRYRNGTLRLSFGHNDAALVAGQRFVG